MTQKVVTQNKDYFMKQIKAIVNNCIKKQDNRGWSLVEMMAALVIMSLIGLGVGGLIVAGSRYFKRSTEETNLQEEAQLVKNYLNNMVVDTALAIGRVTDFGEISGDSCVFVCATDQVRFIALDSDKGELRYMEKPLTDVVKENPDGKMFISVDRILEKKDPPFVAETKEEEYNNPVSSWTLLAGHVESFDVSNSLAKINKKFRIFNCEMEFKVGDRHYKTTHTINLRNDIFNADSMDVSDAYEFIDFHTPSVSLVTIDPMLPSGSRGGKIEFHSSVQGINYPSQEVTWEVSGLSDFGHGDPKSSGTTITPDGVLTIADDETCDSLFIRVTSVLDDTKANGTIVRIATLKSASIFVRTNVREEEADEDVYGNNKPDEVPPGVVNPDTIKTYDIGRTVPLGLKTDVQFAGSSGGNASGSLSYAWDIVDIYIPDNSEKNDAYLNSLDLDPSGRYRVETKEVAGSRLWERVTMKSNGAECDITTKSSMLPNSIIHVTASVTMSGKTIAASNAPFEIHMSDKEASGLEIQTDKNFLNRKGSIQIWGTVLDHEDAEISWEVKVPLNLKGKVAFDPEFKTTTTTSRSGATKPILLYANNAIDYTLPDQKVVLEATYTNTTTNQVIKEVKDDIYIRPVKIVFEPDSAVVVVGNPLRVKVIVQGLEADAEDITFKSTNYVKNMVGPIYSPVNRNMVISVSPPEPGKEKAFPRYQPTVIKAAMKSSSKVTGTFDLDVYKSNITIEGKNYCYVPVPGDTKFVSAHKENPNDPDLPINNETVTIGDNTYIYFVEGNKWGVRLPNSQVKYYYENGTFRKVEPPKDEKQVQ